VKNFSGRKFLKHVVTGVLPTAIGVYLLILAPLGGQACVDPESFTVAVIPDTQNYDDNTKSQPDSLAPFLAQTQYLANHKSDLNLAFVTHVGDVVQHGDGTNYGGSAEADRAVQAMNYLAGCGVPFGMAPGNHDYDNYSYSSPYNRPLHSEVMWKTYFGSSSPYFEGQPWYGAASDALPNSPGLSSYQMFTAYGKKFMHISLEMEAGDTALAWAQSVIDAHPGIATIVTTHEYLNPPDNSDNNPPLVVPAVRITPATYLANSPAGYNDAQGVWDKFIKVNDQIFLVICGHASGDAVNGVSKSENIRIDKNNFGHPVYQVLTDYQNNTSGGSAGGDGWLRLMQFDLRHNTIHFMTYSPWLHKYAGQHGEATFNQSPKFSDFTLDMPVQVLRTKMDKGSRWMTGDFHNHTTFTDGSWPMNDLSAPATIASGAVQDPSGLYKKGTASTGYRYGLDFFINSEHGGSFPTDGFGNKWTSFSPLPFIGDQSPQGNPANMWRWQSELRTSDIPNYSGASYMGNYDWVIGLRKSYPAKLTMTGLEWNVPGHEHCSTAIVSDSSLPIAEFEYRFDNNDTDGTLTTQTAETMGWTGKKQNSAYTVAYPALGLNATHQKAVDAIKWMAAHYPNSSYAVPAHIERKGCGGVGNSGYTIAAFRDMNDTAPNVAFGFEGLPGHQKSPARGEFTTTACGGGTYGGAGTYIATVGGLWDNLLADGRKFYNFDSSDFHDDDTNGGVDFWPGEYEKTFVNVKEGNHDGQYTLQDVVNGLRSGDSFTVHGDLINALDFTVSQAHSTRNHGKDVSATMGETLSVGRGEKIIVQIRFKSPQLNNCKSGENASANFACAQHLPVVHHIQLIEGKVNPTKARKFLRDGVTPNPDYNKMDPAVAGIVKTFDASSWSVDAEGYTTMTYIVPHAGNSMFFRIRGSNLGYGVAQKDAQGHIIYGTDANGSPLINTPNTNNADMAWSDLWFYSNPIFVSVN
jgi:hypothetical protein